MPTQLKAFHPSPFVVIYGPTGVGKTDLSLALAEYCSLAVINMDVGQLYEPFGIGTAKPDWRNEKTPHYLFDHIKDPVDYTVVDYRQDISQLIPHLSQQGLMPCAVGGSGFYAYSLLFEHQISKVADLKHLFKDVSTEQLWKQLQEIDPERAQALNKNDRYRIERALAIWQATGEKPSSKKPLYNPVGRPFFIIGVMREREDLYVRINARTDSMLKSGWVEEVEALVGTPWEQFLKTKGLIGYPEVFDYVQGKLAYSELVRRIQEQTRQYAKRQCSFWRMLERTVQHELSIANDTRSSITSINLTNMPFDRYIKQLSDAIVLLQ